MVKWRLWFLVLLVGTPAGLAPASVAAQNATPPQRASDPAGAPPLFVNMVHETLTPGRQTAYDAIQAALARSYQRSHVPAYWIELESITGASEVLYLNFFDSFDEANKVLAALGASLASHPDWVAAQDRLRSNVSSTNTVLSVRRDGLGYRAAAIDFSKMRVLRLTTVFVRPGHESEFAEVEKRMSAAQQADKPGMPWVVYEVEAGQRTPAFVILTPLPSLNEVSADISGRLVLEHAASDSADQGFRELARTAYDSMESNLYFVNPRLSHMPEAFTADDPAFWRTKAASGKKPSHR